MGEQTVDGTMEKVASWVRSVGKPVGLAEIEAGLLLDPDPTLKAVALLIAARRLRVAPGDDERLLEVIAA